MIRCESNAKKNRAWARWLSWLMCAVLISCLNVMTIAQDAALKRNTESAPDATNDLLLQEQAAFVAAAKQAARCVVQIEAFAGLERVGKELVSDGPTTGTIVDKDGWIISGLYNFRAQPASILVSLPDGSRASARIVARDHSRELVLLKADVKTELPVPEVSPIEEVSVGQWVIGLGKTFERDSVSQSVGIISALGRAYGKAVQTDAKVSPINYGGPLVDLQGRVIGILAPISPGAILEGDSSQLYDSGIGFAVPLADVLARLPKMKEGQDIHSGKLGIVVTDQNELAGPVKVAGAAPGSPAAKAGLKPGDTIIAAGGKKVELLAHLRHALGPTDAGSDFTFTVRRDGKPIELKCTLVEQVPTYRSRYLGIEADNLLAGGVRIAKVLPKSPAAESKLKVGMQIVQCNGIDIKTTTDLRQQVSVAELDGPLKLKVIDPANNKGDQTQTIEVNCDVAILSNKIDSSAATESSRSSATNKIEDIELTLGDFPNKAWAWCPTVDAAVDDAASPDAKATDAQPADAANAKNEDAKGEAAKKADGNKIRQEFGLVIVLPEPGEIDRNKLREVWLPVVREGYCVAVIQSGNKSRWSAEEIELIERVRAQITEKRDIDPARTVSCGQGVGGRLALVGARASTGKIAGAVTVATSLDGVRVQQENSPSATLHFLFIGAHDAHAEFLELLQKLGFPAAEVAVPDLGPGKWEQVPMDSLLNWLVGLGRI